MNKKELIEKYLAEPIKKGDPIIIKGESSRDPEKESWADVYDVDKKYVYFKHADYQQLQKRLIKEVRKNTGHIGPDPFKPELSMNAYQIDIEQLLWRGGIDRARTKRYEEFFGFKIDENGNDVEFQRGLVWTLQQKQLLIESVYNNIEIGKFVFRKRAFKWVEKRANEKKFTGTAFSDLIDGKQRLTAIIGFINDEFTDMSGNYHSDLSDRAQRKFRSYRNLSYVELNEDTTDKDVLRTFLSINHTGIPMSIEHINYVKSIKL